MTEDSGRANPNPPPVDRLSQLWRRINEHKLVQWSVAYIAVAYAFQHAVVLTSEAFEWPDAVLRVSMLLMALGLPVVITLAWYHGERASRHFSTAELTIISLLLVMSSVIFYAFVQPESEVAVNNAPTAKQTGVEEARKAAESVTGGVSIAVLPFANLSADPEQEFFSAGMTEEITSALARIPDLRVVARTSAFQFRDQSRDIRAIAEALHATHLVEGSVRKVGARLRITAQLINAANGVSIWSENYDREMTDIFAIQEDIATAIAGALRMPLGLRPGQRLISNRTGDLKAYEDYLRVRVIGALGRLIPNALQILEEAVARDPGFAPAWATLADRYRANSSAAVRQPGSIEDVRRGAQFWLDKTEVAARKAMELDPEYASGYAELASVLFRRGMWAESERLFLQALALDSDDPETLYNYGIMLGALGRLKEALAMREKLLMLEPFVPIYAYSTAVIMRNNGQDSAATALLESFQPVSSPYNRNYMLAMLYASAGQYTKAVDTLLLVNAQVSRQSVEEAAQLLRTAPTKVSMPETLPMLQAELNFVYAHIGALDRVLEYPERVVRISGIATGFSHIWDPLYSPLRRTERFKTLVRDAGLVDYWRASTWPDLCRPTGAADFACD